MSSEPIITLHVQISDALLDVGVDCCGPAAGPALCIRVEPQVQILSQVFPLLWPCDDHGSVCHSNHDVPSWRSQKLVVRIRHKSFRALYINILYCIFEAFFFTICHMCVVTN